MDVSTRIDSLKQALWHQARDQALILLDPDSMIVDWAGAAPDMFGFEAEEMVGQLLDRLFTDEDRGNGVPEHERSVALSAGRSEDDRWHVRKDGARIWVNGSLVALRDGDALIGFAKIVLERTHQRTFVEALQNPLDSAQHDIANRNAFFGRLAHEIRNCLSPIQSVVTLLEATQSKERTGLPLAVIRRQMVQLERMMKDLTEVARFGAGKLQLRKHTFDLGVALGEIAEAARAAALAKQQTLAVIVPPQPLMIHADRERLHQIVFNLLHNAVKYTPEQGRIWLHCTWEAEFAVIRVEDTGIGISAELLPVIFDLFTQENPEQSEGGFGVGLSLVKDLVEAHDGFVEVSCDGKGKGAVFGLRLPLDLPPGDASPGHAP